MVLPAAKPLCIPTVLDPPVVLVVGSLSLVSGLECTDEAEKRDVFRLILLPVPPPLTLVAFEAVLIGRCDQAWKKMHWQ